MNEKELFTKLLVKDIDARRKVNVSTACFFFLDMRINNIVNIRHYIRKLFGNRNLESK